MYAKDSSDFTNKAVSGIVKGLNNETGQDLTKRLLEMKLEADPNMSAEEWQKAKQQFMVFIFHEILKTNPELMKEYAMHVYNELQNAQKS